VFSLTLGFEFCRSGDAQQLSQAANDLRRLANDVELVLDNDTMTEAAKIDSYSQKMQEIARTEANIALIL